MKTTFSNVISEPDFRKVLQKIKIPTTLIWGEEDTYTPVIVAEIFKKNLPNVKKIKIIPKGKHGIHRTHIRQIVETIFPS